MKGSAAKNVVVGKVGLRQWATVEGDMLHIDVLGRDIIGQNGEGAAVLQMER